jgi:hypothetical protein
VEADTDDIVLDRDRELLPTQLLLLSAAPVTADGLEAIASRTSNNCDVGLPSFLKIMLWMSPFAGP